AANEAMKLPEDAGRFTRASLTSIDPRTGEIKAMYGGPNYSDYPTNAATFRAQGASTFKPFTLIAALKDGIPMSQKYDSTDGKGMYGGPYCCDGPSYAATCRAQRAAPCKPFTLIAALKAGIPMSQKYDSTDGKVIEGWKDSPDGPDRPLSNFDHESFGWIDLAYATAQSVNVAYGQLNKELGADKTAQVAYD